jgi:signal transduction histidine kinase/CheY-like chemotaxis protein/PAS domain-containing protein
VPTQERDLVDLALATHPQAGLLETATAFVSSHQGIIECAVCLFVAEQGAPGSAAEPIAIASQSLDLPAAIAKTLLRHCQAVCSAASNGKVLPLPEGCSLGENARHFTVPGFGFLLLVEDSTGWGTGMESTYLRIIDKLAASLQLARENEERAEDRLKLELATRAANIGFFEWNTVTDRMSWDAGMEKLFSAAGSALSGTVADFASRLHPDSHQGVLDQLEVFLEHGGSDTAEFQFFILTDDGETRRMTAHVAQLEDTAGELCLHGSCYDISELELAQTQSLYRSDFANLLLNLSLRLIKPLEGGIDDLVNEVLKDVAEFVSADRAYIFEYDLETATCSNTHEWCAEGVAPEIDNLQDVPVSALTYWLAAHEKGQPFILRGVANLDDSHPLKQILEPQGIKSLATFPLVHGDKLEGFVGFDVVAYERRWSDVDTSILQLLSQLLVNAREKARTEKQVRESRIELKHSRDRAEELAQEAVLANRSKTEFIARVSHEMRTPLHAINGLTNLLLEDSPAGDRSDYLQTILVSGESMLELINDIVDFTRIDAAGIKLKNEPIDLHELMQHLVSMFEPLTEKKTLSLQLHIDTEVPQWVLGDQLRIRQILQNFLSNAVKFTDRGSITISAEASELGHAPDWTRISFCVADTGIGIPEEEFENLFIPFVQLDEAAAVNRGTGLGLPITRMLTELMEGNVTNIQLEKAPRPVGAAAEEETVSSSMPASLKGLRVLLAEDNPVNAALVKQYLKNSGATLDTAANGAEALALQQNASYDVILMDCEMPVMDGFEATHRIREANRLHNLPDNPIIGVTANALNDDIRSCREAGMSDVLTKPFTKLQLLALLGEVAGAQGNKDSG